jgi:hypothetical protein
MNDVDYEECKRFGIEIRKVHKGVCSPPEPYTKIRWFIEKFYNERALVKNTDEVLGDLYKGCMNSCYGKFG